MFPAWGGFRVGFWLRVGLRMFCGGFRVGLGLFSGVANTILAVLLLRFAGDAEDADC